MSLFPHAPGPLVALGGIALATGGALLVLLAWHALRRMLDRPRVPLRAGVYVVLVLLCAALSGAGFFALTVASALGDWAPLPADGVVAEVRCRMQDGRLAMSFVPIGPAGRPEPEESATSTGTSCDVGGEVLRFRPALSWLGLDTAHRVFRIGAQGRTTKTPAWRALPRPLGIELGQTRPETVAVPAAADRRTRIFVRDSGYWLEKQGG